MARARRSNRGDGFRSTIGKACNAPLIRRRSWATRPAETVTKNIACNSASVAGLGNPPARIPGAEPAHNRGGLGAHVCNRRVV